MKKHKLSIIGLGYVGLPLAVEFAKKFPTVGFDINKTRIQELSNGHDRTLEIEDDYLKGVINRTDAEMTDGAGITFSSDINDIKDSTVYIVTVPTPVDSHNHPDLTPLYKASETVGKVLKAGDIVIYESTVYPGVTEEECVPVLEKVSGLKFNTDFFCGYSPERINPGDKERTLTKILKITSGSTPEAGKEVDELYRAIIKAGTHLAPNMKVAEAAKVIENSQRDINIAFVNELSKIFNRLGIDTNDVLDAAGTKWNFLKFKPGLVGGHCIGVDPYYLAQKAQSVGYHPEIILAGRRLNDGMGAYVANEVVKLMVKKDIKVRGADILVLGVTFKENCPDVRNTRVVDLIQEMNDFSTNVTIWDPWAEPAEVKHEYGFDTIKSFDEIQGKKYDTVILAVSHKEFNDCNLADLRKEKSVVFDIKGFYDKAVVDGRL